MHKNGQRVEPTKNTSGQPSWAKAEVKKESSYI